MSDILNKIVAVKREEVAAAWGMPVVAVAVNSTAPVPPPATVVQKPPATPKVPIITQPSRELNATIPANSADAFPLGAIRSGTKISLQYVSGNWKAWGHVASANPDDDKPKEGDQCRVVIALPSKDGKPGRVLRVVPGKTATKPFVYDVQTDYPELVLRIHGRNDVFAGNPGSVKYSVKIQQPGR